jgi:dienelactone hydrolase
MIEILETKTWHGHRLEVARIGDRDGNKVPCHILRPLHADTPAPFVLATHGATSSKHEWTELDGYTKGGNLALEYLSAGIAVIAMDWHYHGDNDTSDLNGRNVFLPEHFDDFFDRSIRDAETVMDWARQNPSLDSSRMGFSGYSLAGTFGFWLANHGAGFKAMVLCVPGSGRKADKYHSPCNNLGNLGSVAILQINAEQDEYIASEEWRWLFSNTSVSDKSLLTYPSGHSLPLDYVRPAALWLKDRL